MSPCPWESRQGYNQSYRRPSWRVSLCLLITWQRQRFRISDYLLLLKHTDTEFSCHGDIGTRIHLIENEMKELPLTCCTARGTLRHFQAWVGIVSGITQNSHSMVWDQEAKMFRAERLELRTREGCQDHITNINWTECQRRVDLFIPHMFVYYVKVWGPSK